MATETPPKPDIPFYVEFYTPGPGNSPSERTRNRVTVYATCIFAPSPAAARAAAERQRPAKPAYTETLVRKETPKRAQLTLPFE